MNSSSATSPRKARGLLVLASVSAIVCLGSLGGYWAFQPLLSKIAAYLTYPRVCFIGTGFLLALITTVSLLAGSRSQNKFGLRVGSLLPTLSLTLAAHLVTVVWFAAYAGFLVSK